jgi:hypothetical protein
MPATFIIHDMIRNTVTKRSWIIDLFLKTDIYKRNCFKKKACQHETKSLGNKSPTPVATNQITNVILVKRGAAKINMGAAVYTTTSVSMNKPLAQSKTNFNQNSETKS